MFNYEINDSVFILENANSIDNLLNINTFQKINFISGIIVDKIKITDGGDEHCNYYYIVRTNEEIEYKCKPFSAEKGFFLVINNSDLIRVYSNYISEQIRNQSIAYSRYLEENKKATSNIIKAREILSSVLSNPVVLSQMEEKSNLSRNK